jgi:GntR family transcriptional regulator, transcriptional repressor for pyruvate dehydrogenase complex
MKRADLITDEIKRWMVTGDLRPGQRLPNEAELQRLFGMSKGTVREALKALEVQGLVTLKTGPNGGARLTEVTFARTFQLLQNHFFFQAVDIDQIYAVRRMLEPEVAALAATSLSEQDLRDLEAELHDHAAEAGEVRGAADLDFHDRLAMACPNVLLRLQCQVLNEMLRRLVTLAAGSVELDEVGTLNHAAHEALLAAFRARDAERARAVMAAHMDEVFSQVRRLGGAYRQRLVLERDFEMRLRLANLPPV